MPSQPRARNTTAPPAAPRRTGIPPSSGSSARSAAPSRRPRSNSAAARTVIVEHDLVGGAAQHSRLGARMAGARRLRPLPELPGDFGLQSRARRQELRVLRFVVARAVRAGQGRVPSGVAAAAEDRRAAGARSDSRLVRPAVARAERVQSNARSPTRFARSICPTGRSMRRSTRAGRPKPATTTTCSRARTRVRRVRWYPAAGELSHVFDDELVCASVGVQREHAARDRAVSDERARAVRRRLSGGLDGRALPDRSDRGRRALAADDGRRTARAVRGAGSRRHAPQSRTSTRRITTRRSSTSWRRSGC